MGVDVIGLSVLRMLGVRSVTYSWQGADALQTKPSTHT